MDDQANVWRVLFIGLLLLIVVTALARMHLDRRTAALREQAERQKTLPPHIARLQELLIEAQSKAVEFTMAADHAKALAVMYRNRVEAIKAELQIEGDSAQQVQMHLDLKAEVTEDLNTWLDRGIKAARGPEKIT